MLICARLTSKRDTLLWAPLHIDIPENKSFKCFVSLYRIFGIFIERFQQNYSCFGFQLTSALLISLSGVFGRNALITLIIPRYVSSDNCVDKTVSIKFSLSAIFSSSIFQFSANSEFFIMHASIFVPFCKFDVNRNA